MKLKNEDFIGLAILIAGAVIASFLMRPKTLTVVKPATTPAPAPVNNDQDYFYDPIGGGAPPGSEGVSDSLGQTESPAPGSNCLYERCSKGV